MKYRDIDALIEILEYYLDYCTVQEGYTPRYARKLHEDLWNRLQKIKKKALKKRA